MLSLIKKIPKVLTDLLIIFLLTAIAGFSANRLRDNSLSLDENTSKTKLEQKYSFIDIEQAKSEFNSEKAVFLDSRYMESFEKGHIKGAFNLPADNLDLKGFEFVIEYLDKETSVIVYCDGEECDLSPIVFDYLKKLGYSNVKILVNGWELWKQNGFPVNETNSGRPDLSIHE